MSKALREHGQCIVQLESGVSIKEVEKNNRVWKFCPVSRAVDNDVTLIDIEGYTNKRPGKVERWVEFRSAARKIDLLTGKRLSGYPKQPHSHAKQRD